MGRLKDVQVAMILSGIGVGGIGALGAEGITNIVESESHDNVAEASATFRAATTELNGLHTSLDNLQEKLGATCMKSLKLYGPGQALAKAAEGEAATELLGVENQPCGTNPPETRANVHLWRSTQLQIGKLEKKVASSDKRTKSSITAIEDANNPWWVIGFGLGAGAVGSTIGLTYEAKHIVRSMRRRRGR